MTIQPLSRSIPALRSLRGRTIACSLPGSTECDYYLRLPARMDRSVPVLVTVHGISRNAREHLELFGARADHHGTTLVAPCFDLPRFRGYQRLTAGRPRADRFLARVLADASARTGLSTASCNVFGFSGGAQFAHRFALLHPRRVRALTLASSGWYTFPDRHMPYPLGLARNRAFRHARCRLRRFLAIPVRVLVGELDTERDPALNLEATIDEQQGLNRVERAQRWVEAMRQMARMRGRLPAVTFEALPGVGHSFEEGVARGGLDRIVFESLY